MSTLDLISMTNRIEIPFMVLWIDFRWIGKKLLKIAYLYITDFKKCTSKIMHKGTGYALLFGYSFDCKTRDFTFMNFAAQL